LIAIIQAIVEDKYILEKKFGKEYNEYQNAVGMFIPKIYFLSKR
jgi:protein-S-isoprenylcysteine O-methyltransferase Ste14